MIGRVRESRNSKKVIRVALMESYGEIRRVPVNLFIFDFLDGRRGDSMVQENLVNDQPGAAGIAVGDQRIGQKFS